MTDDEVLIRRFVETGDRETFELLVKDRLPAIRRIIAAAGPRNPSDRDDALQEVLIRLFRSLKTYRFDAPLSSWIFRVARNVTLDEERKRRRARNRDILAFRRNAEPPGQADPEDLGLEAVRSGQLKRLFYELDENDRQLLLLREREGLTMDEIAGILGIRPGTVKSRLARARQRARKLYLEASE